MEIEMIFMTLVVARPSSAFPACENVVYNAAHACIHSLASERKYWL